jgi:hypothetical protein
MSTPASAASSRSRSSSRVAVEVLPGAELGRVDEEAHHDDVALGARSAQQRKVAIVQVAHRWHQSDRAALAANRRKRGSKLLPGADELHVASCVCRIDEFCEVHWVHALRVTADHGL